MPTIPAPPTTPATSTPSTTTKRSETPITLTGPFREPAQMLAEQSYGGHKSIHDGDAAAKLGLRGAPIEGPTHFSQFEPLACALWGDEWFTEGCISAHFQNMVMEGESVQATVTVAGPGSHSGTINAVKGDGTPVLTGTISVGTDVETDLDRRLAAVNARALEPLFIVDQLAVGQRSATHEVAALHLDDHLGNLYPFSLRQKLACITESLNYHSADAQTPWGGPILPFEMLSVFTNAFSGNTGFLVRQPSLGLFIDLEVRMINGPVLVGREYRMEREIVGLGSSKRTESYWTRTSLFDGTTRVCDVLLHQGVFKASYAGYPTDQ